MQLGLHPHITQVCYTGTRIFEHLCNTIYVEQQTSGYTIAADKGYYTITYIRIL